MLFWATRGHAAEGLRWYEQILPLPSLPPEVALRAFLGSGAMRCSLGHLEEARTTVAHAAALAHEIGDMSMRAQTEILLGTWNILSAM